MIFFKNYYLFYDVKDVPLGKEKFRFLIKYTKN